MTPNKRRAIRTILHVFGALVALGYLGWIIHRVPDVDLIDVAIGLIALLIIREFFHGAENVTARINFSLNRDGLTSEIDPHTPKTPPPDEVP